MSLLLLALVCYVSIMACVYAVSTVIESGCIGIVAIVICIVISFIIATSSKNE